jgi:hypothetical protein
MGIFKKYVLNKKLEPEFVYPNESGKFLYLVAEEKSTKMLCGIM